MNDATYNLRLSALSLAEIVMLRDSGGAALQIEFLSLGLHHPGMKPKAVIKCPGNFFDEIVTGEYPAWIKALAAGRVPEEKHFTLTLDTGAPEQAIIKIIEEELLYLTDADIFRDGGSLEAVWETNYGNTWALFLAVKRGGKSSFVQYDYLYNCRYMHIKEHNPVLLGSAENMAIMQYLDTWLDEERPSQHCFNRDMMERFFRLSSLYNHLNRRTY